MVALCVGPCRLRAVQVAVPDAENAAGPATRKSLPGGVRDAHAWASTIRNSRWQMSLPSARSWVVSGNNSNPAGRPGGLEGEFARVLPFVRPTALRRPVRTEPARQHAIHGFGKRLVPMGLSLSVRGDFGAIGVAQDGDRGVGGPVPMFLRARTPRTARCPRLAPATQR